MRQGIKRIGALALAVGLMGCSDEVVFAPGPTPQSFECHNFDAVRSPLRVIVMVDNSGSTATTDPNQAFRQDMIRQFLALQGSKPNYSWNLSYFSGSSATVVSSPVYGTSAQMTTALDSYLNVNPSGNTPYEAALNKLHDIIANDSGVSSGETGYVILFMSDGIPNPSISDANLIAKVQAIMDLKPQYVSLSTIFFSDGLTGSEVDDASARLATMANEGHGLFAATLTQGSTIKFSDVATLPGRICQ